jgi:hypothetical protein
MGQLTAPRRHHVGGISGQTRVLTGKDLREGIGHLADKPCRFVIDLGWNCASIVKVRSLSHQCDRASEGTGWVSSPHRVVTNAHC